MLNLNHFAGLPSMNLIDRLAKSLRASVGDIVFGMEDGTVSVFGLVFGVALSANNGQVVLLAGATGAAAAAVSMMAGSYLDAATQQDQARALALRTKARREAEDAALAQRIRRAVAGNGRPLRAGRRVSRRGRQHARRICRDPR